MKQAVCSVSNARVCFLSILFLFFSTAGHTGTEKVTIGVLANQGVSPCQKAWQPTADYLTAHIPGYTFSIVPLGFDTALPAAIHHKVDFIVVNPGIYVSMEAAGAANRIVTFQQATSKGPVSFLGGVIFCRADRSDIQDLQDLKGKRFAAADKNSLGGWQAAWRELKYRGIRPKKDFKSLEFLGTHDDVVDAVMQGKCDAGSVRTFTLEELAQEGKISLAQIRVLPAARKDPEFPFLCSTRLYPEWPFAQVTGTSNTLAQAVAAALLTMQPTDPAAQATDGLGWTIPQSYETVHAAFRDLSLPPYGDTNSMKLSEFLTHYWYLSLFVVVLVVSGAVFLFWVARVNQLLKEDVKVQQCTLQALRESEQRILDITDAGGTYIWELDETGRFCFVSENVLQLLGCKAEYLYRKTPFDYMHKEDAERVLPWFQQRIQKPAPFIGMEYRTTTRNGNLIWLSASGKPRFDSQGVFTGFRGAAFDITERKHTEEALRTSEECFVEAFMSSPDGFVITRLSDGRIIELNESVTEILGYSRSEMLGHSSIELGIWYNEEDRMIFVQRLQKEGRIRHFYVPHRHKTGRVLYVSISAQAIPVGRDLHVLSTFRDITERKQVEDAIREFNQQLQKITSQIPGMVYQFKRRPDGTMCFPYASSVIRDYFQLNPEDVREDASPMFGAIHPDDRKRIIESIGKSAAELSPWEYEYRTRFEDGQERWLYATSVPQEEIDGSIIWHGFISDITERKRASAAMQEREAFLSTLMDSVPVGLFLVDEHTHAIEEVNPAALALFGASMSEVIGQRCHKYICPAEEGECPITDRGQQFDNTDRVMLRKDGTRLAILKSVRRVRIHGKEKLLECVVDITERKRSEEYLRSIMATIQAGMLISDCHTGLIVDANPFAESLTGYSADNMRGKAWHHFMLPLKNNHASVEEAADLHAMMDCNLITAGQDVLHVRVAQARVQSGAIEYLVQSFVDISDIEHLLAEQAVNINLAKRILDVINAEPPRYELLAGEARLFIGMESISCKAAGGDHCFVRTLAKRPGMAEKTTVVSISDQSGHEVNCILRSILTDLIHHTLLADADKRTLESRIGRLNDALCALDFFEEDDFVTAMIVEIGHESHTLRYVSCGHPPLLVIRGAQVIAMPDSEGKEHNLPLGCIPEVSFTAGTFPLETGDRILLYTDGLTEMPVRQKGIRIGVDQLRHLVGEFVKDTPDIPVTEISRRLLKAISEQAEEEVIPGVRNTAADDITMVFMEMEPIDDGQERIIYPEQDEDVTTFIEEISDIISEEWEHAGFDNPYFKVRLVLEEAVLNAWKHGHKRAPGLPIRVQWRHRNDFVLDILNEGEGFTPEDVPDPRTIRRRFETTGRGLFMIRSVSTSVRWQANGRHISASFASKLHPDSPLRTGTGCRFPGGIN